MNNKISTDSITNQIVMLIEQNGPMRSATLKDFLIKLGVSEVAARQRISRAHLSGSIKAFLGLKLPKKENFLFLESQFDTYHFWQKLLVALTETNSAYGIALNSLISRGGVNKSYFCIVSGAPKKLKKHLSSNQILLELINSKFLKLENCGSDEKYIVLDTNGNLDSFNISDIQINNRIDQILVDCIFEWVRNLGLASYNSIEKRSIIEIPDFGNFYWDITAPSYVLPVASYDKGKLLNGFLVINASHSNLDDKGIKYFIKKCETIRSMPKIRPFLPILVAENFSPEAFKIGKQNGIIFTTPKILFGIEASESLKKLKNILENATEKASSDPKGILNLLNEISKIEGAAFNVRGALFEMVVGNIVQNGEGGAIEISKKYKAGKNIKVEVDVQLLKGSHLIINYECKGYLPTNKVNAEEIKTWIDIKINKIYEEIRSNSSFSNRKIEFEFWTSGQFEDDALIILTEKSKKVNKYSIKWMDGQSILKYARAKNNSTMIEILNQHYLKHPLADN